MNKPNEGFENSKEYDYLSSASSQDCTGLIPMRPESEDDLENYQALYPFLAAYSDNLTDDDMSPY